MKRILSFILALVMMCSLLSMGVSAASTTTIQITGSLQYSSAEEVFHLLNEYRQANGLNPLVLDQKITEAAMLRAVESYV